MTAPRKPSLILPVAVVVLLLAAAVLLASKREPAADPAIFILHRVAANENLVRRNADGLQVIGEISDADIELIRAIVRPLTKEPFLWIEVTDEDIVEVHTGVIRGYLDGGGNLFGLRRVNGKWRILSEGNWVS